ncbi:MAG: hypothetical protein IJT94_06455 [Oscillibacter sp.]|nr:hypothetical protein [Oscillibacter sp.]
MTSILDEIICNRRLNLLGKEPMKPPFTPEEERILECLQELDEPVASTLKDAIQCAVFARHIEAARSGLKAGVRLAAELRETEEEAG